MKVSIVTPSFNQGRYLLRTLDSVGRQTHGDVEHIILDPGSKDDSRDIIRRYAQDRMSVRFVAEPDDGQVDAINKGLRLAQGDVVTWLNSDDYYIDEHVLRHVVKVFQADDKVDVVYGKGHYVDQDGKFLKAAYVNPRDSGFRESLAHSIGILQPALFFRKRVFESLGGLDVSYNLSLDYEYWLRMAFAGCKFKFLDRELTAATLHADSKTVGQRGRQYAEICQLMLAYYGSVGDVWIQRYADFLLNGSDGILRSEPVKRPALEAIEQRLWAKYNATPRAFHAALVATPAKTAELTERWKLAGRLNTQQSVVTTASSEYFDQLMTLIAGIHRTSIDVVTTIVVFDLSLTEHQREELFNLDRVIVLPYPKREMLFDGYFNPKAYVYKCLAIDEWVRMSGRGDRFLWMDTGVVPLRSLTPLFALLDKQDLFTVNHDDRTDKPFHNVNFTHPTALARMRATTPEALAEHLCSCLIGCRLTTQSILFFREAYLYSRDKQISNWTKHLSTEERSGLNAGKSRFEARRREIEQLDQLELSKIPLQHIIDIYDYWGHRQDQSIYSVLACRYGVRALSARQYCFSSDESSIASKKNWESGGEWDEMNRSTVVPEKARHAFTFHHRGTYVSRFGLRPRNPGMIEVGKFVKPRTMATFTVGPFKRDQHAHCDETDVVAQLFQIGLDGSSMIDVGAHQGTALAPFLDLGWQIFAFEPDNKNRSKLLERLAKHKNKHLVSLDTRCVSNKSQKGVSFFTSEQSTGISGLSAFHETHQESQKVDITTLAEFFQDKPLPTVDFLKIDTEGHDIFVLQGFPWERGNPAVIECEFEDTKTVPLGYTFHDLARFLVVKGYTVYVSEWHPIIRYGLRHDWRQLMRYPCELADQKGWGNLLAFRDPIDEQVLVAAVNKVLKVAAGDTGQKPAVSPQPAASAQSAVAIPVSGENLGFRFESGAHFSSIAPNQWRFVDAESKQKRWVAGMDSPGPTAGRSFVGSLRLIADRAMTVNVSCGRYNVKSVYEGTTKGVVLTPGVPQTVKLDIQFKQAHQALKLQVEVLDLPGGGTAVLTIDGLGISESVASVRKRVGAGNFNLPTANRLFREGDYPAALGIYLWLGQQRPLSMYGDNAVKAARKACMPWVNTPDELVWITAVDQ